MMMRNILALTFNDLAVVLKNKTIYLILFIPFFVFLSLKLIDQTDIDVGKIKMGLIQKYHYEPQVIRSIKAAEKIIEVTWLPGKEEGARLLKEKKIDGILVKNEKNPRSNSLLVLKKESLHTLAIVEVFSAMQKSAEGNHVSWISDIEVLQEGGMQKEILPTWILMLVLLVGFIILPAQVAEEKEKRLLLALLQTPIREVEWLIAKLIMGMVMMIIAILFLHLLGKYGLANLFDYIALIILGSFCFSAYGIFLGFLCRNQASARTLGVVFYLPHLLPSALSDFSQKLNAISPILPSYQFYNPLKSLLLEDGRIANQPFELIYLFFAGSILFYFSYLLMRKRWLM